MLGALCYIQTKVFGRWMYCSLQWIEYSVPSYIPSWVNSDSRNPFFNHPFILFGGTEIVGGPDCRLFTVVCIGSKVWYFKLMNWVSYCRWWLLKIGLRLPSMLA